MHGKASLTVKRFEPVDAHQKVRGTTNFAAGVGRYKEKIIYLRLKMFQMWLGEYLQLGL